MWTHPSRQKLSKKHSTLHNLLCLQPFLVLTLSPFPLTCEPNTYRFMCSCKMSFQQKIERKNAQNKAKPQKRWTTGRVSPPQRQKLCTTINDTHPLLPLYHSFLLIYSPLPPPTWFSHTMLPKTQPLPCQQERQTRDKNEEEEVFFPPKKSQTTELFGSICYKSKTDTTTWFRK
jgi:hypothetical protein